MKKFKKPIVKNYRVISGMVAISIFIGSLAGCANVNAKNEQTSTKVSTVLSTESEKGSLDFHTMKYGNKTYLTLEKEDLLDIIEQAMQEVDEEYIANGNKTVFNSKDKDYSQFTKYDILGLLFTESTFRLLEVENGSKNIFDVDNYARFCGKDKDGVIYHGPGMINKTAINYIVEQDRHVVNNFKNYEFINIDGKQVKITFENINPYDYVLQSKAHTEKEIKQALKECVMLNVKCIYIYLNRIVKDNVKSGTHDDELNKLEKYAELDHLTIVEKQKAFAFIGYNNGASKTRNSMLKGYLFDKYKEGENVGEYIINVAYASKVMNKSNEYKNIYSVDNELNP